MKDVTAKRYATKQDYAMAMNDPTNWFGGDNKWLGFMAICAIITIVLVPIVLLILRKYFGMNTDLQRINSTVAKFIGLAKILPGANASQFGNGEVKGNCTYFKDEDMLVVVVQVLMTLVALYILYVCTRKLIYYFSMNNVSNMQTKLNTLHFLMFDKTDIYLQLTDNCNLKSQSIYLGTCFGNPEDLETEGQFDVDDVVLETHLIFDYISIKWDNYPIILRNADLQLPICVQIPLTSKFQVRRLFRSKEAQFRLVAYNSSSYKIRAISTFYPVMTDPFKLSQVSLTDDELSVQDVSEMETSNNVTTWINREAEIIEIEPELHETNDKDLYTDGYYKDRLNYKICSMFGNDSRNKCSKCKKSIRQMSIEDIIPMKRFGKCGSCN